MQPISVRINRVLEGSNAERSGLKSGDVFTSYHNARPRSIKELRDLIAKGAQTELVKSIEVVVAREGERIALNVEKGMLGAELANIYGAADVE